MKNLADKFTKRGISALVKEHSVSLRYFTK